MYLKVLFLLAFVSFVSNYSNEQMERIYFRSDYQFLKERQAFYKYHTTVSTWNTAKEKCEIEGAKLFYPQDDVEARAVMCFWKQNRNKWDFIYIGVSALIVKGIFVTTDGIPLSNVYNVWQQGEPNNNGGDEDCLVFTIDGKFNDDSCEKLYPFICKKSLKELDWNDPCNLPISEYTFNKEEDKCYKFHNNPMSWTDAYKTCTAEKSYLAVINSRRERDYLISLVRDQITEIGPNKTIHLGFHNRLGLGWKTLQDRTLEDSGYAHWDNGQPDGSNEEEKCGSMTYTGELHDVQCDATNFFICEHDIDVNLN